MDGAGVEVLPVAELPPHVADEVAATAEAPTDGPGFARAFVAAGGEAVLVRVHESGTVLAHAFFHELAVAGARSWSGLGMPVLRRDGSVDAAWRALIEAARARGVVSASWRDLTLTRLDEASLLAAVRACEEQGGIATRLPFVSHHLDLRRPLDALWTDVHRKHRHAVRAAELAGIRTAIAQRGPFAAQYAPLAEVAWARSHREAPNQSYYSTLLEDLRFVPYLATTAEGRPAAGAIVAVGARSAIYLHGASANTAPGASTLLQWRIVQDLHEQGIASYDLGGDVLPGSAEDTPRAAGIRRFKARFGGATRTHDRLHLQIDPEAYARAKAAARSGAA